MITFQQVILRLQEYWGRQGCALLQPYDMEVGAGTSHTATFLRALGPEPWRAAYVQPSRRPEGLAVRREPQSPAPAPPVPGRPEAVAFEHPRSVPGLARGAGLRPDEERRSFRRGRLGEPHARRVGLGWEVWLNGWRSRSSPTSSRWAASTAIRSPGEITYGLERMSMYLQDVESVYDLRYTDTMSYGDVFFQNEVEQSRYAFDESNAPKLFEQFAFFESEAKRLLEAKLPLPGYEMILKAAHTFNLLDARGAISVTERAGVHRPHPQPCARRSQRVRRVREAPRLPHAATGTSQGRA
jgi:glycyl-tRNA synthetase alpha chain